MHRSIKAQFINFVNILVQTRSCRLGFMLQPNKPIPLLLLLTLIDSYEQN